MKRTPATHKICATRRGLRRNHPGERREPHATAGQTSSIYDPRLLSGIAARWDAKAETWERQLDDPGCHLNEDAAYRRFLQTARSVVRRHRAFCAAHGLIDAGCGTGLVLAALGGCFAWAIGVDISKQMIRVARKKALPNARFLVGDVFSLADCCPQAGMVLSRGVLLSHYGRHQALELLSALRTALLPGGFLVCDFLNAAAVGRYRHNPTDKALFARNDVRRLAREAGFASARVLGTPARRVLLLLATA